MANHSLVDIGFQSFVVSSSIFARKFPAADYTKIVN